MTDKSSPIVPIAHNETDAERAHSLHTNLCKAVGAGRQIAYIIAEILWEIKTCEYYTVLGYNSFHEYTSSPEISIGKSQSYKLADVYELYVRELGWTPEKFDEIPDIDRLAIVGPLIRQLKASNDPQAAQKIEELIEDARVLDRENLRKRKAEILGGGASEETGFAQKDDALGEFVGQKLVAAEPRIDTDGSRKVMFVFEASDGTTRKILFYAVGPDVQYNIGRMVDGKKVDKSDPGW